jgi:hypothetical protein
MRCSILELEEDDIKGTSVPCRLLECIADASGLQENCYEGLHFDRRL